MFTIGLSLGTGLLFGLSPAVHLSRPNLHDALKAGSRETGTWERTRIGNALVVAEVALTVVLLVGGGLLLRSLCRVLDVPLGFNPKSVLPASITLPRTSYGELFRQVQFAEACAIACGGWRAWRAVGMSSALPLTGITDVGIRFDGRTGELGGTIANSFRVTPDFLRVMQIPLARGRLITERDTAASPPVVLINETMARRFFPDEDPIGKRLDISGPTYLREIVGIVGEIKQEVPKMPTRSAVYEAFAQKPGLTLHVLLRAPKQPSPVRGDGSPGSPRDRSCATRFGGPTDGGCRCPLPEPGPLLAVRRSLGWP